MVFAAGIIALCVYCCRKTSSTQIVSEFSNAIEGETKEDSVYKFVPDRFGGLPGIAETVPLLADNPAEYEDNVTQLSG